MPSQSATETLATVTLFSGGFNDTPQTRGTQQTFSIARPFVAIDAAKLAKARADAARVAALCGWN